MVFASIAQAFAFNYKPYVDSGKKKQNMLKTIGYVLNVKDVINDAHNTFIRDTNKMDSEQETILEDVLKDKAFNWSDEEDQIEIDLNGSGSKGSSINTPDKAGSNVP